jgi:hypothetical protein
VLSAFFWGGLVIASSFRERIDLGTAFGLGQATAVLFGVVTLIVGLNYLIRSKRSSS